MARDTTPRTRTCRDDSSGVEVEWVECRCSTCNTWRWIQYFPFRETGRSLQCVYCERRRDGKRKRARCGDRRAGAKKLKVIMWIERAKAEAVKVEG